MNDFNCDKISVGSAWKSPFLLTVHKVIISFPKNDSWARCTANLVNFFLSTNLGYFSTTISEEISLELSIDGRSCTTFSGDIVGMFLPVFVISVKVSMDDDIGVAVVDISVAVIDIDDIGVAVVDIDDIGVAVIDIDDIVWQ